MRDYDAVVIGAGNGGLTASATLAKNGLSVLMLERHNIPGGCATSFCRGRFEFEVALHQLSGMGTPENPGTLRSLMNKLGVMDDLEFVEISELFRTVIPGRLDVTLPTERAMAIEELQKHFPQEKESIQKFFDLMYQFAFEMYTYFKNPDTSREKFPVLYRYAFRTTKEVLDEYFSDPLLKSIPAAYWGYIGLPPNTLPFAYLAMLFFTYLEFKPFHIKGGSQALSNAIVNKYLSYGGNVRFNCGVKEIIVKNREVKGVVTEDGDEIRTKHIVSNASKISTYVELIDPEQVPSEVFNEMKGRTLSPSAFCIYMGMDCDPDYLGITTSENFISTSTDISSTTSNQMRKIDDFSEQLGLTCYDVSDPDFSQKGTCQIVLVALKYAEPWLQVPPLQYSKVKYRCAESMISQAEILYPNLRKHIEEIEIATPLTYMRYLGIPSGAIYGFEQYMKDSLFFEPPRLSPIKGLYFAGGWAGDCGFEPTLKSGASAAGAIIRQLNK